MHSFRLECPKIDSDTSDPTWGAYSVPPVGFRESDLRKLMQDGEGKGGEGIKERGKGWGR